MKIFAIVIALLITNPVFAQLKLAPPSIPIGTELAHFVDFKSVASEIVIDTKNERSFVKTRIKFYMPARGYAIFDSVNPIQSATIDGSVVNIESLKIPETTVLIAKKIVDEGEHVLVLTHQLKSDLLAFDADGVKFAFNQDDLSDRGFLEVFMPSSFQYDQYTLSLSLQVLNSNIEHMLVANGDVNKVSSNHWSVSFPEFYNCTMHWLHVGPKKQYVFLEDNYGSIDGRILQVTVYGKYDSLVKNGMSDTLKYLKDLESKFGAFPHKQVIVYATLPFGGGMEYAERTRQQKNPQWANSIRM